MNKYLFTTNQLQLSWFVVELFAVFGGTLVPSEH